MICSRKAGDPDDAMAHAAVDSFLKWMKKQTMGPDRFVKLDDIPFQCTLQTAFS